MVAIRRDDASSGNSFNHLLALKPEALNPSSARTSESPRIPDSIAYAIKSTLRVLDPAIAGL